MPFHPFEYGNSSRKIDEQIDIDTYKINNIGQKKWEQIENQYKLVLRVFFF